MENREHTSAESWMKNVVRQPNLFSITVYAITHIKKTFFFLLFFYFFLYNVILIERWIASAIIKNDTKIPLAYIRVLYTQKDKVKKK